MGNLLYLLVLIPVLTGVIIYFTPKGIRPLFSLLGQTAHLGISIYVFLTTRTAPMSAVLGKWNPPVGIMLVSDNISGVLVLLSSVLFLSFMIFNLHRDYINRVFFLLYLTLQGMLSGIFLVDDLFSIFVLIEVSTMVVSLLIMFKRDSRSMYDGLIYLLVNTFSMTMFLFGLAMLYRELGTFSLTYIKQIIGDVENIKSLYLPYALMMTAACLKAAIMPLFTWLPKAHGTPSAPSVVSAVLSGLYVKGGIYLFIRLSNAFYIIDASQFFFICGAITAIAGFLFAVSQRDLKLLLSYSTVSQLGIILMAVNMNSTAAFWGGLYLIISHAVFKSTLFLCAGIITESYSTRDIYEISGVFKRMPLISIVLIFAVLAITGAPFFSGSIPKYIFSYESDGFWQNALFILINFGTILYYIKIFRIFRRGDHHIHSHIPLARRIILPFLGLLCLLGGVFGPSAIRFIFGVEINYDISVSLNKGIIFILTFAVAFGVYMSGLTKTKVFSHIRALDLGFNEIALTIPVFFCVLLGYLLIF